MTDGLDRKRRSTDDRPPRDMPSPSHDRAEFNDPLPGGDPTAPGAPHEPGGEAFRQSEIENPATHRADTPEQWEKGK